jgi:hypothetical protein
MLHEVCVLFNRRYLKSSNARGLVGIYPRRSIPNYFDNTLTSKINHDADAKKRAAENSEKLRKDLVMSINPRIVEMRNKMNMRNSLVMPKIFRDTHHCFSYDECRC